ncbi:MAG: tetratricopeptide repeat protein [Desulfuromonadaceae bacterium]|nr:tetratricopeptide repeat protein [Desulfuromonadaceae bacterium]MDD5104116.1 tetratricopeptide repeat protein [Desulfuromonadaceae bacterium]
MILLRLCRNVIVRFLVALVIISALTAPSAYSQETEDSQIFIAGFNAYQQKDYTASIEKMEEVLRKYPDTPLKDMVLFWLSRSYFERGNQQEAARYFSQFSKEYPENPLKNTVGDELHSLAARFEKGEELPLGPPLPMRADLVAEQKAQAQKEQAAAIAAESARAAAAEAARLEAIQRAEETTAAEKRELARKAAEAAEQEAAAKAEKERVAAQEAVERLRAEAENARIATVKAEQDHVAAEKATERLRAEAENARIAAAQAEQERVAAAQASEKLRKEAEAESARLAAQKAERESLARVKAEEMKKAAAESARLESLKVEEERKTAERRAKEAEEARIAARKVEDARQAEQKREEEQAKATKLAYREKAIDQYKSIIDKYPASPAAITAVAKLRELGIAVALPPHQTQVPSPENAQIFHLEVAQFAGFEFNLLAVPTSSAVGRPFTVPFDIINRGNGKDSFYLESAFPADYKSRFASFTAPDVAISQTPELAPGEVFKGVITLAIPPDTIDGLHITYPVKTASRLFTEASQSREIRLIASAPLLRAVPRTESTRPLPGERVVYRIAILNVGSTAATDVTFRLDFPPQLEPVDYAAAGFRQEMKSALVLDGLQVKSGESRELSVAFQLKEDSLAGQELSTRVELINNPLKTASAFVSNVVYVEPQHGVAVRAGSERLVTIPGQSLTVPFIVTNTGNIREKFKIAASITGATDAVIFNDINRDGMRQAHEPVISVIGPLAPREEASVAVEVKTPLNADDGSHGTVQVAFTAEGDATRSASGTTRLTCSRPVLKMAMDSRDARLKPGDIASFELSMTNSGSNIARVVELQSAWPEQLELIASVPSASTVSNGTIVWRFKEMGAGEKRHIKVSFRVKPGIGVGTALQVNNMLTYEDQQGNRY